MGDSNYVALEDDHDGLLKPASPLAVQQRRSTVGGPRRKTVSLAIKMSSEDGEDHKTTFGECFLNLFKSFVGAGILALPQGFARGGIVGSSIMMPLVAVVVWYGMYLLIQSDRIIKQQIFLERAQQRAATRAGSELVRLRPQSVRTTLSPTSAAMESKYEDGSGGIGDDNTTLHGDGTVVAPEGAYEDGCGAAPDCGYEFQPFKCVQDVDPYSEVARRAYDTPGEILFQIMIVFSQVGTCSAYAGFIAKNMHAITGVSYNAWGIILFFLFSILTQVRNPKAMAPTSVFGNVVYVFAITVVIYGGFHQGCCFDNPGDSVNYASASGLGPLFGTSVFALEGIGNVLPFRSKMKDPEEFDKVLKWVLISVTILYIIFSDICYATFGTSVEAPVTDSLATGTVTNMVKVCLSIALLFSYALQLFAVTNFADVYINRLRFEWIENMFGAIGSRKRASDNVDSNGLVDTNDNTSSYTYILLTILLRLCIVGVTITIAITVANFGKIIDVCGAIAGSSVGLIMPALFYLKLRKEGDRVLPWALVFIGATAGTVSLYYTFTEE